jgi:NAD(P)-dependent dehydrogenase (short-subunit alcohol dehydrogenase family)
LQQNPREHFDRQIAFNLRTTMELLQALVPPMAERGWGPGRDNR